jgi:hypothetical protein
MALPRPSLTAYPVRGGMVRDVARHMIDPGVYDAADVIVDIDGKIRKRGGSLPVLGMSAQRFPTQIATILQESAGQGAALIGLQHGAAGTGIYRLPLGGAAMQEYAFSAAGGSSGEYGRPFTYQDVLVVPVWSRLPAASSPLQAYGASMNTRTPANTSASVACTSGDAQLTLAAADVAAISLGDFIFFENTAITFNYRGYVTSISGSTTVMVTPAPGFTSGAGSNQGLAITTSGAKIAGYLGAISSARTGCAFQNRVVLGGVRILGNAGVPQSKPSRVVWSALPTETVTLSGTVHTGLVQINPEGYTANSFLDLPEVQIIRALAPIGPSQLLILGSDQILRLTGTLVTLTTPGQSLPLDVQPISTSVGCLSDRSVQETPFGVVWAYRDGVYRYDGSRLENLMSGRIQTLWDQMQRTSGFAICGSAVVRGDQYLISTTVGGLLCDLRSGSWTRYTGTAFTGSAVDPRDPKIVYACKYIDPASATAPASTRDQLFDLGQLVSPTPSNARDHDGSMVQAAVTTRAMAPAGVDRRCRFRNVVANADIKAVNAQPNGNVLGLNCDAERELYLPNNGAEFGTTDWWRPFANGATTLPGISAVTTQARTGSYSMSVVTAAATGADDGVIYDLPGGRSDGNTIYSVEVWVYLTTAGTVTLTCNSTTATTTTTSAWTQLQVSTRPSSGATNLTVQISHSANSATFYVDDLHVSVLQPVQDRDGAVLLANGSAVHRDTQNARSGSAGFKVVCSGNANEGIAYFARGTYRANTTYTFGVWAKTVSGSTVGGLACGVTGDTATAAITLTSVYKKFTLAWTPTADRTDPEFVVRITAAASATFACDDFQVVGADPQLDISVVGGIEAEGDWSDGTANDETFANFDVDYDFATGSGTLSVSGGQLVPSSTALKVLLYKRGAGAVKSRDGETVMSYTPGHASDRLVCCLDMYDNANYLFFEANGGGLFSIRKVVAGVTSTLNSTAAPTITLGVQYWLVARRENTLLTIEHWTTDPALGGSASMTLTWNLSAADAAIFANPGQFGMRITPGDTALRIDAFRCTPYSNATTVASGNDQPTLQRGDMNLMSEAATVVYRSFGDASEVELQDVQLRADLLRVGRRS